MVINDISVIAFDADDTLWANEPMFQENIAIFCDMLSDYGTHDELGPMLEQKQIQNLDVFGYGSKTFALSMIELAIEVTGGEIGCADIQKFIEMGKNMNRHSIQLIDGVEDVLKSLRNQYTLMMITKGDLVEQERKIKNSGLGEYFTNIEILSEKDERAYANCLDYHGICRDEFLMIGNSVKSDVLPVINIGAQAVHIPYHTTWCHEQVDCSNLADTKFMTLENASELLPVLLPEK